MNHITQPIRPSLDLFRCQLQQQFDVDTPILRQALDVIARHQGKHTRPILMLLIASAIGRPTQATISAALAIELLHNASLVHDDVVDHADTRRGAPATHTLVGNKAAVLVGDYLLSRALQAAADTGNTHIVSNIARLGATLATGELLQLHTTTKPQPTEADYYDIITRKTAALFATAARIAAITAGGTPGQVDDATHFATTIGTIFQIQDDILDYHATDNATGKPPHNDMQEGKLTLPAIHALTHADGGIRALALHVQQRTATPAEIEALTAYTIRAGGIQYAQQAMATLRHKAQQYIDRVGDDEIAQALNAYADLTIARNK